MTVQFLVTFAAFLVEYQDFLASALIVQYLANDFCACYVGSTYGYIAVVVHEQHFVEYHFCTFLGVHTVDEEFFAGLYFELLALHVYNCVHCIYLIFNYIVSGGWLGLRAAELGSHTLPKAT